jgi:L-asparaginase
MLSKQKKYILAMATILILCVIILLVTNKKSQKSQEPFKLYEKPLKTLIITTGNFQKELANLDKLYKNHYDTIHYNSSPDIQSADWNELSTIIFENYTNYSAFIILHPPETLSYTACGLSFILENLGKTIAFSTNPILSMKFVKKYRFPEVVIIDEKRIIRACRSKRIKTKFMSLNFPALAMINNGKIKLNEALILQPPTVPLKLMPINPNKKIIVVKIFPNITSAYLQNIIKGQKIYGIILESYENGYIPEDPKFTQLLTEIIKNGTIIVSVSQTNGNVLNNSLENIGVISAGTMTTEAAYAKISLIVSHVPYYNNEMAQKLIQTGLRGEI